MRVILSIYVILVEPIVEQLPRLGCVLTTLMLGGAQGVMTTSGGGYSCRREFGCNVFPQLTLTVGIDIEKGFCRSNQGKQESIRALGRVEPTVPRLMMRADGAARRLGSSP